MKYIHSNPTGLYKRRIMKAITPVQQMLSNGRFVLRTTQNQQQVFSKVFLRGVAATAGSDSTHIHYLSELDPVTDNNNRELFIYNTSAQIKMMSATNAMMEVVVYDVKAQRDMQRDDTDEYPHLSWNNSGVLTNGGNPNTTRLGVTPFNSGPTFGTNWHITRTTRKTLNPGQAYIHSIKTVENYRAYRGSYATTGPLTVIRKRTYGVIIVIRGFPISSASSADAVSLSACALDCQWTYKCKYSFNNPAGTLLAYAPNVLDPLDTVNDPTLINDDSGQSSSLVVL